MHSNLHFYSHFSGAADYILIEDIGARNCRRLLASKQSLYSISLHCMWTQGWSRVNYPSSPTRLTCRFPPTRQDSAPAVAYFPSTASATTPPINLVSMVLSPSGIACFATALSWYRLWFMWTRLCSASADQLGPRAILVHVYKAAQDGTTMTVIFSCRRCV